MESAMILDFQPMKVDLLDLKEKHGQVSAQSAALAMDVEAAHAKQGAWMEDFSASWRKASAEQSAALATDMEAGHAKVATCMEEVAGHSREASAEQRAVLVADMQAGQTKQ